MTAQAVAALRVRTDLPRTRFRGWRSDPVCVKLALRFQRCSWRYPWSACRSGGAGARGGAREIEATASAQPESLNLRLYAVQRIALTLGSLHGLVCLDSLGPASNCASPVAMFGPFFRSAGAGNGIEAFGRSFKGSDGWRGRYGRGHGLQPHAARLSQGSPKAIGLWPRSYT